MSAALARAKVLSGWQVSWQRLGQKMKMNQLRLRVRQSRLLARATDLNWRVEGRYKEVVKM